MTSQGHVYWECEKCQMTLPQLADSDLVLYEPSLQSWICLKCSVLKPEYVKILRKDRLSPERRVVERSKNHATR